MVIKLLKEQEWNISSSKFPTENVWILFGANLIKEEEIYSKMKNEGNNSRILPLEFTTPARSKFRFRFQLGRVRSFLCKILSSRRRETTFSFIDKEPVASKQHVMQSPRYLSQQFVLIQRKQPRIHYKYLIQ